MGRPETGRTGARFGAPARRARGDADPDPGPAGTPGAEAVPGQAVPGDAVPEDAVPEDAVPEIAVPGNAVPDGGIGLTGARFGGRTRRPRTDRPATDVVDDGPAHDTGSADRDDARPTVELPLITGDEQAAAIGARPYVLTGGRTRVRAELRIETLVSALGPPDGETGERHTVLTLCERPRSVGEVAALTGVPLGVARVLVDDLAGEGRVRLHLVVDPHDGPDMELLDRVLSGLRRL